METEVDCDSQPSRGWAGEDGTGSCYAYSYAALGELPAVLAAAFLTLEYGVRAPASASPSLLTPNQ